jgi:23S rRNA (uracil1939-C5)-methyltransferase
VAPGVSPAPAGLKAGATLSSAGLKAGAFLASAGLKPGATLPTAMRTGGVAIDLYAGVGLFTLPLAQQFDLVMAVEAHPQSAADLAANARSVPGKKIRAFTGTTSDFLRRCAQMEPDVVLMDPPRAGVRTETLTMLLALHPKHLHYISCSPPTLARDLGFLLNHGYNLDSVEMFDFFPQTYHIESLAKLSRRP